MTFGEICAQLQGVEGNGNQRSVQCPAHEDKYYSFCFHGAGWKNSAALSLRVQRRARHVHMYRFFSGVTRILTPNNLKTGVIKNTRGETILNKTYQEMAEHYGTVNHPGPVQKSQR